jgi:hypothetical protein
MSNRSRSNLLARRVLSRQSLYLWSRHSLLLRTRLVLIERLLWFWSRMSEITTSNLGIRWSSTISNYSRLSMATRRFRQSSWWSEWLRYWDLRYKYWARLRIDVFELGCNRVVSNLLWFSRSIQRCSSFVLWGLGDNIHYKRIWCNYNCLYLV